jgi:hypothetical protein
MANDKNGLTRRRFVLALVAAAMATNEAPSRGVLPRFLLVHDPHRLDGVAVHVCAPGVHLAILWTF